MFNKNWILFVIVLLFSCGVEADQKNELIGDWCFYEQSKDGNSFSEKVDIALKENGQYLWKEGEFEQTGNWSVEDGALLMSNVGTHKIIGIDNGEMLLERYSIMKFKKGKCDINLFSDQDITGFHNAASTGELNVVKDYLARGMDVNIVDWNRKDSALIKAAKFCKIDVANFLLENGADKNIKNEEGKMALDFAKSSSFHKGCDPLVQLLQ